MILKNFDTAIKKVGNFLSAPLNFGQSRVLTNSYFCSRSINTVLSLNDDNIFSNNDCNLFHQFSPFSFPITLISNRNFFPGSFRLLMNFFFSTLDLRQGEGSQFLLLPPRLRFPRDKVLHPPIFPLLIFTF